MNFKIPEIGNTGAFDTFNIPDAREEAFLSQSQEDEIRKNQAERKERINTPSANEMTQIMGTMQRIRNSPVPDRPASALSQLMRTPEAQEITRQQREKDELAAVLAEREYRSASSNSSGSSKSSRSSSRSIKPMKCVWCERDIFSYYNDMEIHPSCYATYKIFYDHYNGQWRQAFGRDLTLEEAKKEYEKLEKKERLKLQKKKKRIEIENNAKLMRLKAQGQQDVERDILFPQINRFSGIPNSPDSDSGIGNNYKNAEWQTGNHSELLGSSDEEEDEYRYSTRNSNITEEIEKRKALEAEEIEKRKALEARRKKHAKMIKKNKTKCKKRNKNGACVMQGGKKRRKTKKRKKKKRKTHRKRKSKKSKKRRKTRRK
tara:strand:+ start:269 stop:1390 length:1122 start_codon:yes stop_codon:yes gene_type:complete